MLPLNSAPGFDAYMLELDKNKVRKVNSGYQL